MFKTLKRNKLWKQAEQCEKEIDLYTDQIKVLKEVLTLSNDEETIGKALETLREVEILRCEKQAEQMKILDEWYRLC